MRRRTRGPDALAAPGTGAAPAAVVALAVCAALAALALLAGCAKKGLPSGGPPDLEPPRMAAAAPDSGAAAVGVSPRISVTFSEGMEPRSTGEAVELAPPVPIRQRRWSGRTLTLTLKDSLKTDHTYTLFVGSGARDLHGNNLVDARAIVFTTATEFPRGGLEGKIDAVGFKAPGTTLWCYRDGHKPDSTARDFDALGVADAAGNFRVSGLAVPGKWRVWGFADLNHNRSFEPATDLLVEADTLLELTAERPVASDIRLRMLNPFAPGRFAGTVIDSLGLTAGQLRIYAISQSDSTQKFAFDVPDNGVFDLSLQSGVYRVRAFRDLDKNRAWKRDTEPASDEYVLDVKPAGEITEFMMRLVRPAATGAAP